jgi:hypothetical protein
VADCCLCKFQNATASGAKRKIDVSFGSFGGIAPPDTIVFGSKTSGDMSGESVSIVLTQDGKITRYRSSRLGVAT